MVIDRMYNCNFEFCLLLFAIEQSRNNIDMISINLWECENRKIQRKSILLRDQDENVHNKDFLDCPILIFPQIGNM